MALALFDLDHTLLEGDSDQLWGDLLFAHGLVDARFQQDKDRFFADYQRGELDIHAFVRCLITPIQALEGAALIALLNEYEHDKIRPQLRADALCCWRAHQARGDHCVLVTATNELLAGVSAKALQADALVATELEQVKGRFTGAIFGLPAYREGKLLRMQAYCDAHGLDLASAHFYSDSHNDLPLLQAVAQPQAVRPDPRLAEHARAAGWPILDWR